MEIKTKELEGLFQLIIEKLEKSNINSIEFDTDWYWEICNDEIIDFKKEPSPVVGSLSDDIDIVKRILSGKMPFSYMDFDRIAAILKVIHRKQDIVTNKAKYRNDENEV